MTISSQSLLDLLREQIDALPPDARMVELRKRADAALTSAAAMSEEISALDDAAAEAAARAALSGTIPTVEADRRPALRDAAQAANMMRTVCGLLAEEMAPFEIKRLKSVIASELDGIRSRAHERQRAMLRNLVPMALAAGPGYRVDDRVIGALAALESFEVAENEVRALAERMTAESGELARDIDRHSPWPSFRRAGWGEMPEPRMWFSNWCALPEREARSVIAAAIHASSKD